MTFCNTEQAARGPLPGLGNKQQSWNQLEPAKLAAARYLDRQKLDSIQARFGDVGKELTSERTRNSGRILGQLCTMI